MENLIRWIKSVEDLASILYLEAAECMSSDPVFSSFLHRLADDETWHFHLLGSAFGLFSELGTFPEPGIEVDQEMRERIEAPLRACRECIAAGECTRERIIATICETEFSEWNRILVYVLSTCSAYSKRFQSIASIIQGHEKHIVNFLKTIPEGHIQSQRLEKLPPIWRNRYLIVDDDDALRELFCQVFEKDGEIFSAANGREALAMTKTHHFDVIL